MIYINSNSKLDLPYKGAVTLYVPDKIVADNHMGYTHNLRPSALVTAP